MFSCAFPTFLI